MSSQRSIDEATDDGPTVGAAADYQTHYAHARYAARNEAGIIWYDARDGRECFVLDVDTDAEALDADEKRLASVRIGPFRPAEFGREAERYVVERNYVRHVVWHEDDDDTPDYHTTESTSRRDVVEGLAAAREFCREKVPGYAEAPYRDAVATRLEADDE